MSYYIEVENDSSYNIGAKKFKSLRQADMFISKSIREPLLQPLVIKKQYDQHVASQISKAQYRSEVVEETPARSIPLNELILQYNTCQDQLDFFSRKSQIFQDQTSKLVQKQIDSQVELGEMTMIGQQKFYFAQNINDHFNITQQSISNLFWGRSHQQLQRQYQQKVKSQTKRHQFQQQKIILRLHNLIEFGGLTGVQNLLRVDCREGLSQNKKEKQQRKRVFGINVQQKSETDLSLVSSIFQKLGKAEIFYFLLITLFLVFFQFFQFFQQDQSLDISHLDLNFQIVNLIFVLLTILTDSVKQYTNQKGLTEILVQNSQDLSDKKVQCLRNGKLKEIDMKKLLVGDIVLVESGDIIGVDGIICSIASQCLIVQQSDYLENSQITITQKVLPPGYLYDLDTDNIKLCDQKQHCSLINCEVLHEQHTNKQKKSPLIDPFLLSGSKILKGRCNFIVCAVGHNLIKEKIIKENKISNSESKVELQDSLQQCVMKIVEKITKTTSFVITTLFIVIFVKFIAVKVVENYEEYMVNEENNKKIFLELIQLIQQYMAVLVLVMPGSFYDIFHSKLQREVRQLQEKHHIGIQNLNVLHNFGMLDSLCIDKTGLVTDKKEIECIIMLSDYLNQDIVKYNDSESDLSVQHPSPTFASLDNFKLAKQDSINEQKQLEYVSRPRIPSPESKETNQHININQAEQLDKDNSHEDLTFQNKDSRRQQIQLEAFSPDPEQVGDSFRKIDTFKRYKYQEGKYETDRNFDSNLDQQVSIVDQQRLKKNIEEIKQTDKNIYFVEKYGLINDIPKKILIDNIIGNNSAYGSQLQVSLLSFGQSLDKEVFTSGNNSNLKKIFKKDFEYNHQLSATIVESGSSLIVYVQGSVEQVQLSNCTQVIVNQSEYYDDGQFRHVETMEQWHRSQINSSIQKLLDLGLQVILIGYQQLKKEDVLKPKLVKTELGATESAMTGDDNLDFHHNDMNIQYEMLQQINLASDLTLVALLGIRDNINKNVYKGLELLNKAKIDVQIFSQEASYMTMETILTNIYSSFNPPLCFPNDDLVPINIKDSRNQLKELRGGEKYPEIIQKYQKSKKYEHVISSYDTQTLFYSKEDQKDIFYHFDQKFNKVHGQIIHVNVQQLQDQQLFIDHLYRLQFIIASTGEETGEVQTLRKVHISICRDRINNQIIKNTANVIMYRDNLCDLYYPILSGRNIYFFIRQLLLMDLSLVASVSIIFLCSIFQSKYSPFTSSQILYSNFIFVWLLDSLQYQEQEPNIMESNPIQQDERVLTQKIWRTLIGQVIYNIIIFNFFLYANPQIYSPRINFESIILKHGYENSMLFNSLIYLYIFYSMCGSTIFLSITNFSFLHKGGPNHIKWYPYLIMLILIIHLVFLEHFGQLIGCFRLNLYDHGICLLVAVLGVIFTKLFNSIPLFIFSAKCMNIKFMENN